MRVRTSLLAVVAAMVLVAGACGSSSKSKTTSTTAASGGTGATTATTAASGGSNLKLTKPVKIVLLAETKGESAIAVDSFDNAAQLAIDTINKAGGIGGQQVSYTRIPASPLDPQNTNAAYLKALDANPTVLMGLPGGGTQVSAVLSNIEKGGIPLLVTALPDEDARFGGKNGSQWAWFLEPSSASVAAAGANFFIQDLGLKKIGLMGTNEGYGNGSIAASKAALSAAGLTPFAVQQYSPVATDLTTQVLAMKGADGVLDWGYPNPVGVQLKQFQQNGLSIPSMSGGSSDIAVAGKLASGDAIAKLYGDVACAPAVSTDATAQAFTAAYLAKYSEKPQTEAVITYDGIFVIKAAIEKAGSTDPAAINAALAQVQVSNGTICGTYHGDGSHILNHQVQITSYSADGSVKIAKTVTIPDLPKAGS